jgi:4-hydroxy-tetrahydrodipicolinate synthase
MSHPAFSGVITAIATPFNRSGEIDNDGFRKLLKLQRAARISGVIVNGTTGESPTLSEQDVELLVGIALEERDENFHVYVGTGSNDTRKTISTSEKYARFVGKNGKKVDGVMAVVPYYNKPTQQGLFEHFSAVAQAVHGMSLCVYNVPGRTGATLLPETFVRIAQAHANVVAIKEAAGDLGVIAELRRGLDKSALNRTVEILSGDDPTYAPALLCGATGVISVTTHLIPGAMIAMLEAAKRNNLEEVRRLHLATYPLNKGLFCVANPIALKWALGYLGVCESTLRLPLTQIEPKEMETVKAALETVKAAGMSLLS